MAQANRPCHRTKRRVQRRHHAHRGRPTDRVITTVTATCRSHHGVACSADLGPKDRSGTLIERALRERD
jgi:hypothetical protein